MEASNAEAGAGIFSPTFIGGSGFPTADAIVGNVSGVFWHLGNGLTGTWTPDAERLPGWYLFRTCVSDYGRAAFKKAGISES